MKRDFFRVVHLLIAVVAGYLSQSKAIASAPATNFSANFYREHVFMVDNDGKCIDPVQKWKLPGGKKDIHIYRESLDLIGGGLTNWVATNTDANMRVVIFVHGGMNPYPDSLERVNATADLLLQSNCYPIFVVWDSGPFGSYKDHLLRIRQGEEHPVIGAVTSPFMLVSDLARGLVRFPITFSGRIYNDWRSTELPRDSKVIPFSTPVQTARWEGFESLINSNRPNTYHPPRQELNTRSWAERNMRLTEYFLTMPTKIVTLPILDGLGTEAWNVMLRRTRTMFERSDVYDVAKKTKDWHTESSANNATNYTNVDNWLAAPVNRRDPNSDRLAARGAMVLFCKSLAVWSTNSWRGNTNSVKVELFGHSMGSIVINEMVKAESHMKLDRIVYLGAACSIEDFKGAVLPYLQYHTNTQFFSVSLHRMCEREEYCFYSAGIKVPVARDLIVRGSLLNWVDDIFAKPNAISDRTLGAWENITAAQPDIPDTLKNQVHFRCCSIETMPVAAWFPSMCGMYEPQTHGAFNQTVYWDSNFYWPNGFNTPPLRKD